MILVVVLLDIWKRLKINIEKAEIMGLRYVVARKFAAAGHTFVFLLGGVLRSLKRRGVSKRIANCKI